MRVTYQGWIQGGGQDPPSPFMRDPITSWKEETKIPHKCTALVRNIEYHHPLPFPKSWMYPFCVCGFSNRDIQCTYIEMYMRIKGDLSFPIWKYYHHYYDLYCSRPYSMKTPSLPHSSDIFREFRFIVYLTF